MQGTGRPCVELRMGNGKDGLFTRNVKYQLGRHSYALVSNGCCGVSLD